MVPARCSSSPPLRLAAAALSLAALAAPRAQTVRVEAGPDPYTNGEPEALAKAGYVSFGPFPFGTGHTTAQVEELLGTEPLIWIETAHFRIGCALPALELKGREEWSRDWIAKTRDEIAELRKVLPGIQKKPKVLDPWLRAHLIAWRLEQLYAGVLENLGRTDDWFPRTADDPTAAAAYRGLGPYLGMKEKFAVLLLQQGASHARYTRAYHGAEIDQPIRYHDIEFGSMYWGCSEETANGLFRNDMALHAHLNFNVAHNLYTCYRGFGHHLPAWLATGLGHWHSRRVSPRFPTFDRRYDEDRKMRSAFWEWDKRVHGLTKHDVFEPLDAFLDRANAGDFGLEQHIQSWALVDFLIETRRAETFAFVHALKEPFHARRRVPTEQELRVRQRDALRDQLSFDAAALEAAWREHVLDRKGR